MTGTELAPPLVNPMTGEVVPLDLETDLLARERRAATEMKTAINQYVAAVDEELTRRLDRMGRRSADVGGFSIETKAPTITEYPEEQLRGALEDLIDADLLDDAVLDEVLVPQPVTHKLNRTRLNTLLKHPDERVREALAACAVETEQRRSVTVKEKP